MHIRPLFANLVTNVHVIFFSVLHAILCAHFTIFCAILFYAARKYAACNLMPYNTIDSILLRHTLLTASDFLFSISLLQSHENFEVNNVKLDCGANNHDAGCTTTPKRVRRSSHFNQLTWNIDRLDQRHLPLDGEFCPLADGKCC